MGLARVLDVTLPEFLLLTDWRDDRTVELADGVTVSADEYRQRIMHDTDARGFAQLMAQADVQELADAVMRLRMAHGAVGRLLRGASARL